MYCSDNPPVIHVSLDGYRADYYQRMLNPNLQFIIDTGVRADYMRSQYPTQTFPNHYTIMTVSECINNCTRFEQTFEGSNLQMLILHYIMKYV